MTELALPVIGPVPLTPMLGALAAHSLPGVQVTSVAGPGEGGSVRRALELEGQQVEVEVRLAPAGIALRVPDGLSADRLEQAERLVREWLDLDLDPAPVEEALGADPLLAPLLARHPGLRIVGHPDPFEAAVTTVVGQRVSLAAARVFARRLVEHLAPARGSGELRPFPGPEELARQDPERLRAVVGLTGARARTVVELGRLFAAGFDPHDPDSARVRARLLAVPGIGPWTVDYLAVRILGDRDAYPSGDLVLQRALGVRSAREAEALAEGWRPWRAYGLFHLWTAESYVPGESPGPSPSVVPSEPTGP